MTLINSFRDDALRVRYELPEGSPVVVNWTGMGVDTVNTVDHGKWNRRLANCQCEASNPIPEFSTELPKGVYFAGRWKSPTGRSAHQSKSALLRPDRAPQTHERTIRLVPARYSLGQVDNDAAGLGAVHFRPAN